MGAVKDLEAIKNRIKSRFAYLQKSSDDYVDCVKRLLVTLDKSIDAIDLAEDAAENKDKPVKERQGNVDDVVDKQRKKFLEAVSETDGAVHKITAGIQQIQAQIEEAEKEAKKLEVKVK